MNSGVSIDIVVAIGRNGVIGRAGALPWRMPSDLAHFKAVTMGLPVLMGRKTFASIGRPLPGRANIVLTRDPAFAHAGVSVAHDLEALLAAGRQAASASGATRIAVFGGAALYHETLAFADRLMVSQIDLSPDGDAVFPPIDPGLWREASRAHTAAGARDDAGFDVVCYVRR